MSDTKKILIADDDIDVIDQLTIMLSPAGYTIKSAESQAEAEAMLDQYQPDVAIVDLMMENMDSGFVLSHTIKRKYPDTGVILLSAVASETGIDFDATTENEKEWMKADTLLDKPVRAEQIRTEVERLLHD